MLMTDIQRVGMQYPIADKVASNSDLPHYPATRELASITPFGLGGMASVYEMFPMKYDFSSQKSLTRPVSDGFQRVGWKVIDSIFT